MIQFQGFVVCVLRNQPSDVIEFAAQYFADLLKARDCDRSGMGTKTMTKRDDEVMVGSDNEDIHDGEGLLEIFFQ